MRNDLVTALACVCNGWIILGFEWDSDEILKTAVTQELEEWFALNPESEGFSKEEILGEIARKTGAEIRTILSRWMQSNMEEYVDDMIASPPEELKASVCDWMKGYAEDLLRMQPDVLKTELVRLFSDRAKKALLGSQYTIQREKWQTVFGDDAPQLSPFLTAAAYSVNPVQ